MKTYKAPREGERENIWNSESKVEDRNSETGEMI